MKVLIDHSGYELNNIGDLAMLVACVRRIQQISPTASVSVITVEQTPIAEILPGVESVLISRLPWWLPERIRARGRVRWKRRAKWLSSHGVRALPGGGDTTRPRLASLDDAIRGADLVIAAGGGYLNDIFPAHGRGVLHTLRRAQSLGKATAMFGQGIGPIASDRTMGLTAEVLQRVGTLTLREGVEGPPILEKAGVASESFSVTGDDALYLAANAVHRRLRDSYSSSSAPSLGLNLRLAGYAGTDLHAFAPVRQAVAGFHERLNAPPVVGVPIMSEESESDLIPIRWCIPENAAADLEAISNPDELVERVLGCRALVTGSYHAAVFALSVGVPVVGLSNSEYYDWKFAGLRDLYGPQMVRLVGLSGDDVESRLSSAMDAAWHLPSAGRLEALSITEELLAAQDRAYRTALAMCDEVR